jgi:hypothetical protein
LQSAHAIEREYQVQSSERIIIDIYMFIFLFT